MLLAGDVGGTKTDLIVVSAEAGPRGPVARGELTSASYTRASRRSCGPSCAT